MEGLWLRGRDWRFWVEVFWRFGAPHPNLKPSVFLLVRLVSHEEVDMTDCGRVEGLKV